jgi:hypothetical protein
MQRSRKLIIGGSLAALALGAGAFLGVAAASSGDDERPIAGAALERASAAALASTGAGRVSDTEVGDEDGYYEVEVTLDGGRQVDVALDRDFTVLGTETDREDPADRDTSGGG